MAKPTIRILENVQQVAEASADEFIARAKRSIEHHGRFTVALSGGSTPKVLHGVLVERALAVVPSLPPGNTACASTGCPARSFERRSPTGPYPSNASPSESKRAWQEAQAGFSRCRASISRSGRSILASSCGNSGTTAGGGGKGMHRGWVGGRC